MRSTRLVVERFEAREPCHICLLQLSFQRQSSTRPSASGDKMLEDIMEDSNLPLTSPGSSHCALLT